MSKRRRHRSQRTSSTAPPCEASAPTAADTSCNWQQSCITAIPVIAIIFKQRR
uniref:Uncharacterized protein n=1 Tax=Rhizophora mucronata TaxID=61149 RepID=A0A2P2ITG6_RHIMU